MNDLPKRRPKIINDGPCCECEARIANLEAAAMNVIERRGYRSSTLKVGAMTLNEAIDNLRDVLNSKGKQ